MSRFPRPHHDDILLAVIGPLGGVPLWGLGLHTTGVRDFLPAWVTLVPLAVMAFLELLRRSCPSTALLIGTVTVIADQFPTAIWRPSSCTRT